MTTQTLPHIDALTDLLSGMPDNVPVSVGESGGVAPVLVLYPDPGASFSDRLGAKDKALRLVVIIHAVGKGPEQAVWVMDHARDLLVGARPTVQGRVVHPIKETLGPAPLSRDDDVDPPLFLVVSEIEIYSEISGPL